MFPTGGIRLFRLIGFNYGHGAHQVMTSGTLDVIANSTHYIIIVVF